MSKNGLVVDGEGWFVVNARESRWKDEGPLGSYCTFEGKRRFPHFGINVSVLEPGERMGMYHREDGTGGVSRPCRRMHSDRRGRASGDWPRGTSSTARRKPSTSSWLTAKQAGDRAWRSARAGAASAAVSSTPCADSRRASRSKRCAQDHRSRCRLQEDQGEASALARSSGIGKVGFPRARALGRPEPARLLAARERVRRRRRTPDRAANSSLGHPYRPPEAAEPPPLRGLRRRA